MLGVCMAVMRRQQRIYYIIIYMYVVRIRYIWLHMVVQHVYSICVLYAFVAGEILYSRQHTDTQHTRMQISNGSHAFAVCAVYGMDMTQLHLHFDSIRRPHQNICGHFFPLIRVSRLTLLTLLGLHVYACVLFATEDDAYDPYILCICMCELTHSRVLRRRRRPFACCMCLCLCVCECARGCVDPLAR